MPNYSVFNGEKMYLQPKSVSLDTFYFSKNLPSSPFIMCQAEGRKSESGMYGLADYKMYKWAFTGYNLDSLCSPTCSCVQKSNL